MLGFLGALKSETSFLFKQMKVKSSDHDSSCHILQGSYRGRAIVLVTSGMGKALAEHAARRALDRYPISLLISIGFAGALTDALDIGDIVLGSSLQTQRDVSRETAGQLRFVLDESTRSVVADALTRSGVSFHPAAGATVPDIICDSEAKTALASASGAQFADMESYWLAAIASERSVPFVTLRTISDTKQRGLLPFTQMMRPDGQWKGKETARYFLQHPRHLLQLLRLGAEVHRATNSLKNAIEGLVDGLVEGERP
ncbi:hypothetical protein KKG90_01340 [Candidatus Bipolaricaulota bacterium]|nr:hypothetical protein [Candidatus Bipolaricaulota bacterium]